MRNARTHKRRTAAWVLYRARIGGDRHDTLAGAHMQFRHMDRAMRSYARMRRADSTRTADKE